MNAQKCYHQIREDLQSLACSSLGKYCCSPQSLPHISSTFHRQDQDLEERMIESSITKVQVATHDCKVSSNSWWHRVQMTRLLRTSKHSRWTLKWWLSCTTPSACPSIHNKSLVQLHSVLFALNLLSFRDILLIDYQNNLINGINSLQALVCSFKILMAVFVMTINPHFKCNQLSL